MRAFLFPSFGRAICANTAQAHKMKARARLHLIQRLFGVPSTTESSSKKRNATFQLAVLVRQPPVTQRHYRRNRSQGPKMGSATNTFIGPTVLSKALRNSSLQGWPGHAQPRQRCRASDGRRHVSLRSRCCPSWSPTPVVSGDDPSCCAGTCTQTWSWEQSIRAHDSVCWLNRFWRARPARQNSRPSGSPSTGPGAAAGPQQQKAPEAQGRPRWSKC